MTNGMNMRPHPLILAALAVLFTACSTTRPTAGTSIDPQARLAAQGIDAVLWQNASAEVYWIYQQAYEHALIKLVGNIAALNNRYADDAPRRPMAVIVDIDETVLDNSPYQITAIKRGRTFNKQDWKDWTDRGIATASPGAVDFLRNAAAARCEVFYITNRDTSEGRSTLRNLADLGFPDADDAHLLLMSGSGDKTARRATVAATHDVVLLVGDQLTDFDERFADRGVDHGRRTVDQLADSLHRFFVLLPNPMYGAYRDVVRGKGSDAERHDRVMRWIEENSY